MKIAIPLDENKKDVCQAFARAPFFLFEEDGKLEAEANPAAEAAGGAGLKAAQFVLDRGADVLITPRCGENAGKAFEAAGCKVYKSEGSCAEENIGLFKEGKLNFLTKFHAGYHGLKKE